MKNTFKPVLAKQLKQWLPVLSRHQQLKHRFAIASTLLGDPNLLAWSNLGFWHNIPDLKTTDFKTSPYQVACTQLAQQVGLAADLQPNDHVLDLGCGQGASLVYWTKQFGTQHLSAFEIQPACIARIQAANLPQLNGIYQAAFDQLPLPDNALNHAFDAVVCVDAAYHAHFCDFLAVNMAALKPQGRIAFTTLSKSNDWSQASLLNQILTLKLLNLAYVPAQNLLKNDEIKTTLQQAGFTDIRLQVLDAEVFTGFARYIEQLNAPNTLILAAKADWLKIKMTARLCAFLAKYGLVHYVLVSARLA
ncbi:class I SAM-dependent methyltransferase [Alkanindiges illinoisensis]|uniref:Class I SAM-dependent methyltransferase n=1 Tax=Alkanindiges illinoisensis TaxID=197183 RepID=A0A4Y7X9H4_9GAMM|nr:class I SAM-dependent methyltransferase [Alkanindiges illinoisensis]TEU24202.1 class I SAM-dependent methyltransferase [Alkanindiges illinoisensis]